MNKFVITLLLLLPSPALAQSPAAVAAIGTTTTVGTAILVTKLAEPVAIRSFSSPGSFIGASEHKTDPWYTFSRFALYGAVIADLGTTEYVIAHGGRELDPILGQDRARRIGLSIGLSVAADFSSHFAYKHGQRRLAKTLNFILAGSRTEAAVQNVLVMR